MFADFLRGEDEAISLKAEKNWKHEKDNIPPFNYGERSKNSVVCGVAELEFAQELWLWSSVAALYAWAKRLKVSCKLFWSLFWDAVDFCRGSERDASGVQQEPKKFMRHCPNKDRWRRLAVHLECWVTKTSIMCSACVGLRFLQMRRNWWPSAQRPPMVDRIKGRQLLVFRSLPSTSLRGYALDLARRAAS